MSWLMSGDLKNKPTFLDLQYDTTMFYVLKKSKGNHLFL